MGAFRRCFWTFGDVLGPSGIFFWMFRDLLGQFRTLCYVWVCFGGVLKRFGTFWDVLGRFKTYWDVLGVFWDVFGTFKEV